MHRIAGAVLGVLCLIGGVMPLAAQRGIRLPPLLIEEPRPQPTLPVALVPFTISGEVCQQGYQPIVTFKLYSVLARAEATLHLRSGRGEPIDSLRLRCGDHVAVWDGTIDGGARLARPGLYYLRITTDRGHYHARQVIIPVP